MSAGITTVAEIPSYNTNTHKLVWNREITEWDVVELNAQELEDLNASKWDAVRQQRNSLLNEVDQRVLRYQSEERVGITTHTDNISDLDAYMQDLRNIPQTYSNPDDVVWPSLDGPE